VPVNVIDSARKKLLKLEQQSAGAHGEYIEQTTGQLELFNNNPHPVVESLQQTDVDELTPKQALDLVYQLVQQANRNC